MRPVSPDYSIVPCHGWIASNLLAHAVQKHVDITCAHSSANILASDARVFNGQGLQSHIPALRKEYVERQTRCLKDAYADFSKYLGTAFVGSVNSYRLRDIPAQTNLTGETDQKISVADVIRHPLDLVVSGYGQFKDFFPIDLNEFPRALRKIVDQGLEIAEAVCKKHNVKRGDFALVCFLGACVVLGSLRLDIDALTELAKDDEAPWAYRGFVKMEEVTQNPGTYAERLGRLTNQKLEADSQHLHSVFSKVRVNVHNHFAPQGTEARWQSLQPWQRDAFRAYFNHFQLQSAYEEYGYDFSFLEEN